MNLSGHADFRSCGAGPRCRRIARHAPHSLPPQAPNWLDLGVAADIAFSHPGRPCNRQPPPEAHSLRDALGGAPVDVFVQPFEGRRKRLFLADMDSTMIGQECIDELADFVGVKTHVAAITERAMRGEIAFEPALRERVALLKGLARNDRRQGDRRAHHA